MALLYHFQYAIAKFLFHFKVVKSPQSKRRRFVFQNVQDAIFENVHSK